MDILDLFLRKISYKFPKGYPDLNSPGDQTLLQNLIKEYTDTNTILEKTKEDSSSFGQLVYSTFKGKIPPVKGKYSIPKNGGKLNINPSDKEAFEKLFKVKPNSGVGNGEVSLYWLFNYKNPKSPESRAQENRGGDNADLIIDNLKCEVKSYKSHEAKIGLGKFKDDTESRGIITKLFGVLNLTSIFEGKKEFVSEVSFNLDTLNKSYEQVIKTKSILSKPEVKEVLGNYDVFKQLETQINSLMSLVKKGNSKQLSQATMAILLSNKLMKKPGPGGYVINLLVSDATDIYVHKIPSDIKNSLMSAKYEDLEKSVGVQSAEIQLRYSIFDK